MVSSGARRFGSRDSSGTWTVTGFFESSRKSTRVIRRTVRPHRSGSASLPSESTNLRPSGDARTANTASCATWRARSRFRITRCG